MGRRCRGIFSLFVFRYAPIYLCFCLFCRSIVNHSLRKIAHSADKIADLLKNFKKVSLIKYNVLPLRYDILSP
jgi:hypothetical protein